MEGRPCVQRRERKKVQSEKEEDVDWNDEVGKWSMREGKRQMS